MAEGGAAGDTASQGPLLPVGFARRFGIVALPDGDAPPRVTAKRDVDVAALQEARRVLGRDIALELCSADALSHLIEESYGAARDGDAMQEIDGLDLALLGQSDALSDILDDEAQAPVIQLINTLFRQALRRRASDMHIEAMESGLRVRMRIDGVLQAVLERTDLPTPMVVSRLKVMAGLNIAETRLPQDGRIALTFGGRSVDVRVSTMPSKNGERVVLRILDKSLGLLSLDAVGLEPAQKETIIRIAKAQDGLLLVTGPTGSGKTTTLYSMIDHLNKIGTNILTVEDPIEYDLPGVGQTQVNSKIDMTFAKALRAILRQDPDVVLVGEIRDAETAKMAIQAALTGHLVLSTLHTNTALGAVTRLRDLGVEPYLLSSTLRGAIAQRLLRRLCANCKAPAPVDDHTRAMFARNGVAAPAQIFAAQGCSACGDIGYTGRMGLYEIVENTPDLRSLIYADGSEADMIEVATEPSARLFAAGLRAVAAGRTDLDEVLRVASEAE
ncbi:MAG: GspE/PulE family protein [Pseudomonadota bacterium]